MEIYIVRDTDKMRIIVMRMEWSSVRIKNKMKIGAIVEWTSLANV